MNIISNCCANDWLFSLKKSDGTRKKFSNFELITITSCTTGFAGSLAATTVSIIKFNYQIVGTASLAVITALFGAASIYDIIMIARRNLVLKNFEDNIKKTAQGIKESQAHFNELNLIEKFSSQVTAQSGFELPEELFVEIFGYLNVKDICKVSLVCKKWYLLSSDSIIWKKFMIEKGYNHKKCQGRQAYSICNNVKKTLLAKKVKNEALFSFETYV